MPFVLDVGDRPGPARERAVTAAASAVKRGELIVLPTESTYGISADPFSPAGIARLREAKGIGMYAPIGILVGSPRTVNGIASGVSAQGRALIEAFWPGELTLVVREQPTLAWSMGGEDGVISVRMPLHPVALDVLAKTGPLAVTGAQRAGATASRTCDQAQEQFGDDVTVYLEAGPSGDGPPSTIVDITGDVPILLREGAFGLDSLRQVCADLEGPAP